MTEKPQDRPIRRRDRALGEAEALEILDRSTWGVLATVGEDGWPYAVPLNHALVDGALVLHCASSGHKLENLAGEPRVSYCAVASEEVLPAELATRYESAIVFGRARRVDNEAEKRAALEQFGRRFAPEHPAEIQDSIAKDLGRVVVLRIEIERVTGKARR